MVALNAFYWEGISADMRRVLIQLGPRPFTQRFYLAGGTALSLQIGHRRSVDLDFFSEADELDESSRNEIIHSLSAPSVQIVENVGGNLLFLVDGVRAGFFSYGYPLMMVCFPVLDP